MRFHPQIKFRFLQPVSFSCNSFYAVAIYCLFKIAGTNANAALQFMDGCLFSTFFKQVKYPVRKQAKALTAAEKLFNQLPAF